MFHKSEEKIRLNTIAPCSVCDGPGIRMVLFLQGCQKRCRGCHNPATWDTDGGQVWQITKLVEYVCKNAPTKRITISGGEPLEQADALYGFLLALDSKNSFDTALYTSYEITEIPPKIIEHLDYIKTGPYIEELRTTVIPFVGSSNQRFYKLNRRRLDE